MPDQSERARQPEYPVDDAFRSNEAAATANLIGSDIASFAGGSYREFELIHAECGAGVELAAVDFVMQ